MYWDRTSDVLNYIFIFARLNETLRVVIQPNKTRSTTSTDVRARCPGPAIMLHYWFKNADRIDLHTFVDASEDDYASVFYISTIPLHTLFMALAKGY